MAITYDGALFGAVGDPTLDYDSSRYYSTLLGSSPTGDFAIGTLVKFDTLYTNDPQNSSGLPLYVGQNFAPPGTGTGGSDSYIRIQPLNFSTLALRGQLQIRLVNSGTAAASAGSIIQCTSVFAPGDIVRIVVQSNAGNIEVWTCKTNGTPVLEFSGARNAGYTTKALGTWRWMAGNPGGLQDSFVCSQAFSSSQIAQLAAGVDPETIVSSGNRTNLWLWNSKAASIPGTWGATAATQNASSGWANTAVRAPLIPNAADALTLTNEPPKYGGIGLKSTGVNPTWKLKFTYAGSAPSGIQVRLASLDGTDVFSWTNATNFTASAGSGTAEVALPKGGPYRVDIRDAGNTARICKGGSPFSVCPVMMSTGQSPYVFFENGATVGLSFAATLTGKGFVSFPGTGEFFPATNANVGIGYVDFLNTFYAQTGIPVVATFTAVTGASSQAWATKAAVSPGGGAPLYPFFLIACKLVKDAQDVMISWLNGAADAALSASSIKANFDTILSNFDGDLTTAYGVLYRFRMIVHNRDSDNSAGNGKVRAAQMEWVLNHALFGTKVLLGVGWLDMQLDTEQRGAVQAATSNTITLAATDTTSTNTGGFTIVIVSGTGAGQSRSVASSANWNATTKVATVSSAWTTVPDSTSTYASIGASSPHPNWQACKYLGPRLADDTATKYGLAARDGMGPTITGATIVGDGTTVDVTIAHKNGANLRTPNGGTGAQFLAGWEVSSNGGTSWAAPATAAIVAANKVRLTFATAINRVRYGWGIPIAQADFYKAGAAGVSPGIGDLLYDDAGTAPLSGLPVYSTLSADIVPQAAATSMLRVGAATPSALKVGASSVSAVYVGSTQVL